MSKAEISSRQVEFDLPAMIVTCQGQVYSLESGVGKDFWAVRKEYFRNGFIEPMQRSAQIGVPGAEVIDPGDSEGSMSRVDHAVCIIKERNIIAAEDRLDIVQCPVPMFVVA